MLCFKDPVKSCILQLVFARSTDDIDVLHVAHKIKVGEEALFKALKELEKEEVILIHRKEGKVIFRANLYAPVFLRWKRLYNMNMIYDSGLVDYLIKEYDNPDAIVLIGSMSTGKDKKESDIDIVIVTDKQRDLNLGPYQKHLARSIQLFHVNLKTARPEIINTLANGFVLYGYLNIASLLQ
ncbi:nucleotidyltransferase domain-containing protein [Candidatus Woesearchaeota archaeon]|nr:nucleotidyltransferase domain-containing protein [Candidatus Woesearchaeota archaeon]